MEHKLSGSFESHTILNSFAPMTCSGGGYKTQPDGSSDLVHKTNNPTDRNAAEAHIVRTLEHTTLGGFTSVPKIYCIDCCPVCKGGNKNTDAKHGSD